MSNISTSHIVHLCFSQMVKPLASYQRWPAPVQAGRVTTRIKYQYEFCYRAGHLKYNLSKSRKVLFSAWLVLLSFLPLIATCLGLYSPEMKSCCQHCFSRCLMSLTLKYLINNSDQRHGSLSPCAFIISSELRWKTWPCLRSSFLHTLLFWNTASISSEAPQFPPPAVLSTL